MTDIFRGRRGLSAPPIDDIETYWSGHEKVQASGMDAEVSQLNLRLHDLYKERKKVGPSLKEVKVKFRKEWLPVWLTNPQDYRPGTRMPRFRYDQLMSFAWTFLFPVALVNLFLVGLWVALT